MDVMSSAYIWLWGLLILWAILLFGGFVLGKLNQERSHRIPTVARIGSSLALVILVWGLFLSTRDTLAALYSLLIAIGMTLGFVGDLCMARLLPLREPVLGGIAAFGLGHIAYCAALLHLGDASGLNATPQRLGGWVFWLIIAALGWYLVVYRRVQTRTGLHLAALPYALLLASTTGLATGLALQDGQFVLLAVGTALFLISDLVLAAQLFAGLSFQSIGDFIWLTYGPAQMLIVVSIISAYTALSAA